MNLRDFAMPEPQDFYWLVIPGEPESKKRYAFSKRSRSTYNPSKKDETRFAWALRATYPNLRVDAEHQWGIRAIFFCSPKRGSVDYIDQDGDNMMKFVKDALQSVVWENDRQVKEEYTFVRLGEPKTAKTRHARTELVIYRLTPEYLALRQS